MHRRNVPHDIRNAIERLDWCGSTGEEEKLEDILDDSAEDIKTCLEDVEDVFVSVVDAFGREVQGVLEDLEECVGVEPLEEADGCNHDE